MVHLIDKNALAVEIENLLKPVKQRLERDKNNPWDSDIALYKFGVQLIKNIEILEVKEVDLEKEIKEYINDEWCDEWSGDVGNWIRCRRGTTPMEVEDVKDIAKHFFELGLSASNPLTWKDMRELHIIFESLDVDIELSRSKLQKETLGYYEEVLKRFKEKKEE